jgi:ferredoxin
MKITVDHQLCQGHGQCAEGAGDLFEIRDDGFAHPLRDAVSAEEISLAEQAALRCPADAISLSE